MSITSGLRSFPLFIPYGIAQAVLPSPEEDRHTTEPNQEFKKDNIIYLAQFLSAAKHSIEVYTMAHINLKMVSWLNAKPLPIWAKILLGASAWPTGDGVIQFLQTVMAEGVIKGSPLTFSKLFSTIPGINILKSKKSANTILLSAISLIINCGSLFYIHEKPLLRKIHSVVLLAGINAGIDTYLHHTLPLKAENLRAYATEFVKESLLCLAMFTLHRNSIEKFKPLV